MAYPASARADSGPGPREPGKSDPNSPGWADVRALIAVRSEEAAAAAAELAQHPDCVKALRRADLIVSGLNLIAEIVRRCAFDETLVEAERQKAYAQGVADCKAASCRLTVVGGRPR